MLPTARGVRRMNPRRWRVKDPLMHGTSGNIKLVLEIARRSGDCCMRKP